MIAFQTKDSGLNKPARQHIPGGRQNNAVVILLLMEEVVSLKSRFFQDPRAESDSAISGDFKNQTEK